MQQIKASVLILLLSISTSVSAMETIVPDTSAEYDISLPKLPTYDIPLEIELQEYMHKLCLTYRIPYELIIAVIKCESTFRVNIISNGDYGLMQINWKVHRNLFYESGFTNVLNPYHNVNYGIQYLTYFYKRYDKDEHAALMCYNMGENRYLELKDEGINSSEYSRNVMEYKQGLLDIHYGVKEGDAENE